MEEGKLITSAATNNNKKISTPPALSKDLANTTVVNGGTGSRKQSPILSLKKSLSSGSKKSSPDDSRSSSSKKDGNVDSSKSGSTTSAADSTNSLSEIANENDSSNDLLFNNSSSNGFDTTNSPSQVNPQRVIQTTDTIPHYDRHHHALDEEKISAHLEKYLLANDNKARTFVYSSTLGGTNVYCFAPSVQLKRNYWTLVTMGMSGTAMKVPTDIADGHLYMHAEVMSYLPADWVFPQALGGKVDAQNWPVEMLRSLARYVNTTGAWLAEDHGVPNLLSDPPGLPFTQQTKLSHMILLAPVNEDEEFASIEVGNTRVNFYLVIPITAAEATWKREMGAEKSIYYVVGSQKEGGDDVFIDYIIDPLRPCTVDDLNCREIFDNQSIQEEDDNDEYGEFEDLDTDDSNEQITSEENNSGETEQCSDSSEIPVEESSEGSDKINNQNKRVKRE